MRSHTWPRVFADSWRRNRRLLLPAYLGGALICLLAAIAGGGLYYYTDFRDGGGRFAGLMSLASGFALVAFGWSLLGMSAYAHSRRERAAWLGFGLLAVLLAFDEVAQIHEPIAHALARAGVVGPLWLDPDLYVFGFYALVAGIAILHLWPRLREVPELALPAAVALVCFAISQGFDMLPWEQLTRATQRWVGPCEEGFKCLGSWSLAIVGLLLPRTALARQRE